MMKKMISGLLAASVAVCSFTSVFAATQYSDRGAITVESDIRSDNNTKKASVNGTSKLNITSLFSWSAVNSRTASEKNVIITSNAGRIEEGTDHPYIPSEVSLRVVNPDADNRSKFTAGDENEDNDGHVSSFEYFTLTVSDENGVVFETDGIPAETTELTIPLGVFNYNKTSEKSVYSDERKYTISLKENPDLNRSDVIEYAVPTKWEWYVDTKQQPDYAYGIPTPTPEIDETSSPTVSPEAEQTIAPAAEASPDVSPSATPRVRPTTTPRVRTTTRPRTTATPKASSKPSNSASSTPSPKTNPKTGDTAPIGALSLIGILSLAVIAVIQIKKNRD